MDLALLPTNATIARSPSRERGVPPLRPLFFFSPSLSFLFLCIFLFFFLSVIGGSHHHGGYHMVFSDGELESRLWWVAGGSSLPSKQYRHMNALALWRVPHLSLVSSLFISVL